MVSYLVIMLGIISVIAGSIKLVSVIRMRSWPTAEERCITLTAQNTPDSGRTGISHKTIASLNKANNP